MAIGHDSELERADEALRFQAELLDAVGQAIFATDPAGLVVYWNRAAEHMYGWSAAEAIGRRIADLVRSEETGVEASLIRDALIGGEIWAGEFWVHRRDGERRLVTDDGRMAIEAAAPEHVENVREPSST